MAPKTALDSYSSRVCRSQCEPHVVNHTNQATSLISNPLRYSANSIALAFELLPVKHSFAGSIVSNGPTRPTAVDKSTLLSFKCSVIRWNAS